MKYFLDTEFIEKPGSIELISIGIVAEDGRKYYAISNQYDWNQASTWVKDHVIRPMFNDAANDEGCLEANETNFHRIIGKPKHRIADEVRGFTSGDDNIQFYGYFSDYDWVVFCWLFGTMMELPKGFPMFCMDLKQMLVERGLSKEWKQTFVPDPVNAHSAMADVEWNKVLYDCIMDQS